MAAALERRLASFRLARTRAGPVPAERLAHASSAAAERLAAEVDGELVRTAHGAIVRLEGHGDVLPVDRDRLASLPGQPPPGVPLVCLDTETTGLATASGTLAFLVGLGWWEGARFRQVQLLLPDHAFEPVLLDELRASIPAGAWLVTYNGRTFDWPLLVARYRMARRDAPAHAGHLDLLPFVRRVFRHRLPDARLRTVESAILGVRRATDVEGWQIPGRYFDFLRGGPASPLRDVLRHNSEDVRSLGLLVGLVERRLGDPADRCESPPGDLAGLARVFAKAHRLGEALACLDAALAAQPEPRAVRDPFGRTPLPPVLDEDDVGWLSRRRPADFGGRPSLAGRRPWPALASAVASDPWTAERMAAERARLLRRIGRYGEAEAAWLALTERGGSTAIQGWIEIAKLREHQLADPVGALSATRAAASLVRRQLGPLRLLARLDRELTDRSARLRRQLDRVAERSSPSEAGTPDSALRQPDRAVDAPRPGLRPLRTLDPPQEGAADRRAERLERVQRRRVVGQGPPQVVGDDHRIDLVERVP
jgi:hypothetical protein